METTAIPAEKVIGTHLDGSALGLAAAPFVGFVASIAIVSHLAPCFWDRHFGKPAIFWMVAMAVLLAAAQGAGMAAHALMRAKDLLRRCPFVPSVDSVRQGPGGALAPLLALLNGSGGSPRNFVYFWVAGGLSASLDKTPAYLVLFYAAGGKANEMMGTYTATLAAISPGSVFMGAAAYIGNAPNFMAKATAAQNGVNTPSFLDCMVRTVFILIPSFLLVSWLFFW